MMEFYFVYILKSVLKEFIYIGSTHNLTARLDQHNNGQVQSTKAYRPLKMVAYIAVETEAKSRELEKYLKTGSGKAILKKRILTDGVRRT